MAIYGKYVTEGVLGKSIPKELKLTEEDIFSASKFKSKTAKTLKYFDDNNFSEKQISKTVCFWYYGIVGNTFGGNCKKYEPKMEYYISIAKKRCDEKYLTKIKNDMEKTIKSLEDMKSKGKELNDLQKDWLTDIKKVVNKI